MLLATSDGFVADGDDYRHQAHRHRAGARYGGGGAGGAAAAADYVDAKFAPRTNGAAALVDGRRNASARLVAATRSARAMRRAFLRHCGIAPDNGAAPAALVLLHPWVRSRVVVLVAAACAAAACAAAAAACAAAGACAAAVDRFVCERTRRTCGRRAADAGDGSDGDRAHQEFVVSPRNNPD